MAKGNVYLRHAFINGYRGSLGKWEMGNGKRLVSFNFNFQFSIFNFQFFIRRRRLTVQHFVKFFHLLGSGGREVLKGESFSEIIVFRFAYFFKWKQLYLIDAGVLFYYVL